MNHQDPKKFDWDSVGLDFGNWEEEKIWALDLPIEEIDIDKLLWHFDVPFWENDSGERYVVTPRDVVDKKQGTSSEYKKMEQSDLSYPLDIFENKGRWLILDGLHRLVKYYIAGKTKVKVRKIPKERFPEIASEHPIELPRF